MLKRVKIHNAGDFGSCVYSKRQKQEKPNQVPAKDPPKISRFSTFKDKKALPLIQYLRPDVQGLVVDSEDAEEDLFDGPLGTVVAEDVLVVSEVSRQCVILHELVLHLLPESLPFRIGL